MSRQILKNLSGIKSYLFRRIYTPTLAWYIRRKTKIKVLFVLQYLSEWKTEALYVAMLKHPRFEPLLGITPCIELQGEEKRVMDYCEKKEYKYVWIDPNKNLVGQQHPDIVIHQKLYDVYIHSNHQINKNRKALFVYVPYAFNNIITSWITNSYLSCSCWQFYFENDYCCEDYRIIHRFHGHNFLATGFPMMDMFLLPKNSFPNPWFKTDKPRKRIIYSPHHSIADSHLAEVNYSTFLENCFILLQMAEKYKEYVYFVFKPHPRLYRNLVEFWGKEKTDEYYSKWNKPGISNIEYGEYLGLFKHSDAMIHDCGSFIIEYMYTGNPVMYLVKETRSTNNMTQYAKKAYELHYKGKSHEDIEQFIKDVIAGHDPLKEQRAKFVASNLTPPHGKTACQNIINAILGEEDYS